MDYRQLARTGLQSPLCLGTMNFGPQTSEPDSHTIMDAAHEHGINFFDTANGYGGGGRHGGDHRSLVRHRRRASRAHRAGHQALRRHGRLAQRGQAVRAQHPPCPTPRSSGCRPTTSTCTRCTTSTATPRGTRSGKPSVLRQQGKVLYFGSSNFAGWHIAQAQASAQERNLVGLVSEQSLYNLLARFIELEVLPAAEHYGLGVIPWSPLAGGLLGGVLAKEKAGRGARQQDGIDKNRDAARGFEKLCADLGEQPGTVALAWLLTRPAVTAPIIGPRTLDQLDAAERALEVQLDDKTLARLDEIFPGHKTAPEDYAW